MNKTISKALLCGLVASTFILVNCQNDPAKRGVKADVGTPAATDANGKIAAANFPTCSPDLLSAYNIFKKVIVSSDSLLNIKKEDVTASVSDSLLRQRTELFNAGNGVIKEMDNLKADPVSTTSTIADSAKKTTGSVTGCFKADDKINPITVTKITDEIDRVDKRIASLTGIPSDRAKLIEVERKTKLGKPVYSVSTELNDILGLPSSATNNYLVDGKFTDSATLVNDQNDKVKSVCRVTSGGSKLDENNSLLILVNSLKTKLNADKDIYELVFSAGSDVYQIKCYLPSGVKFDDGLARAVGQNLTLVKVPDKEPAPATTDTKPSTAPTPATDVDLSDSTLNPDLLTS